MEVCGLLLNIDTSLPPTIRASGELNYVNCKELAAVIQDAQSKGSSTVELMLGGLDFCDSSGLRVLVLAAQNAKRTGHALRIKSMTPQLEHLLDVSGFYRLFDVQAPRKDKAVGRPKPCPSPAAISFHVPAALAACRDARAMVWEYAASAGCDQAGLEDIKLAVGEAVSNAIRHGKCNGAHISLDCRADNGKLLVTLNYPSEEFDPAAVPVPDPQEPPEGRMGIHFMRLVLDDLEYAFRSGFVTVTLSKRLSGN